MATKPTTESEEFSTVGHTADSSVEPTVQSEPELSFEERTSNPAASAPWLDVHKEDVVEEPASDEVAADTTADTTSK